jgi:uncharacterized 2Fe-2S/4Fe-4S cluster protein (DUF4445 family)
VTLNGAVSEANEAEQKAGTRLSCQAVLLGDARVILADTRKTEQIEVSGIAVPVELDPMEGRLGAAVDIGTTTLALKLYDLSSGTALGEAAMLNPQTSVAADVMGRISAAMDGQLEKMRQQIVDAIASLLTAACKSAGQPETSVDKLVLTGNTTMLYLLTGRDPECLSHAPFKADTLFGNWDTVLGRDTYLPSCMNAFVGADITCAVLASGMTESSATSLLCDIGTNGEIALWKDGRLYVTSTAAGPAFEGAGISCGCSSIQGAIDKVRVENGAICAHTIGEVPAVGICGSGLIDAIAAFLAIEEIDETGAIESDDLPLRDGVALQSRDVRAVQLAKAAIAAGIETLMESAGTSCDEIETLYIAGGFGSHLNVASAAAIGLIPGELAGKVKVIGNASLSGSIRLLLNRGSVAAAEAIAGNSSHVNLGGNPRFNEHYMDQMFFPETD